MPTEPNPPRRVVMITCPRIPAGRGPPGSHSRIPSTVSALSKTSSQSPASRSASCTWSPDRVRVGIRLQAQPRGQRRELVRDQRRLIRGDPPHQVIVPGVGVGVLGGQLGLAHPAQPVHRLHRHPRPGRQPRRHRRHLTAPPGEIRVLRRDLPHPRHLAGEPRPRHRPPRPRTREPRRDLRLGPAADRGRLSSTGACPARRPHPARSGRSRPRRPAAPPTRTA